MPLECTINNRKFIIKVEDLRSAMCSTDECLDAGFNMQLEMLSSLLETMNGEIKKIESMEESDLNSLQKRFPGTTKSSIEKAIKAYHNHASNMYNI